MKLDRLLSRIRSALQDFASEFEQRALAAEYAELCALAAQRLEQIVPLIREGQDYPALQIAEAPPPVLDLIRQLSFAEAGQWRAFCRQRGLPVGQPFDEQHVNLVNQLYGKKISETHPLYRDYRQAIRTHNYDQALRVLQSIRRVNPDDANAHAENTRLARKVLAHRCDELAAALDRGDTPRALALVESIEADDLPGREQNPVWPRAIKVRDERQLADARARCAVLARQLRAVRAADNWRDALPLFAEWDTLRGQFEFALSSDDERDAAQIREWAAVYLNARDREEERQRLWHDLTARLDALAHAPANRPQNILHQDLKELLTFANAMDAQPAAAEGGAQPPPELLHHLKQEIEVVRRLLARRRLQRAAVYLVSAAAVLMVVLLLAWQHMRQTQLKTQTALIMKHLEDGSVNALADDLRDFDARHPNFSGSSEMEAMLKQAHDYVSQRQATRVRFDREFGEINRAAAANPTPLQIADLLAKLDALNPLAKDLAKDDFEQVKPAAQQLRTRLTQALASAQGQRVAGLTEIVNTAQKLLDDKLTDTSPADVVVPVALEAQQILARAAQIPPDPDLSTPAEATVRTELDALAKKVTGLIAAGRAAMAARTQLLEARTLDEYRNAIEALATNLLTSDPDVSAAHAISASLPDWTAAAQRILLPGEIETWAFLQTAKDSRLQPATNAQNEDVAFQNLVGNDLLGNIRRAELVTYDNGLVTKRAPVFLAGPMIETVNRADRIEETRQVAKIVNSNGTTTDRQFRYLNITGQKPKGERIEDDHLAPESNLIRRLSQAFDPRTGVIREPLLRVLDDVRAYPDVSSIFKAYLMQEILRIAQMRPRDWGFTFSPSAQADALELTKITGGSLAPRDWLFPVEGSRLTEFLQGFFERTAGHNYYNEATQNFEKLLALRLIQIQFAGHVDLQSLPRLLDPKLAKATLWGLDVRGRWQPLYEASNGQTTAAPDAPTPARLSPLVYSLSVPPVAK